MAATTDDKESTIEMAEDYGLTMPIGYGVSDEMAFEYVPWYGDDDHGHYHQPMEFLISRGGNIFGSMYATGPIGRMFVDEVIVSVTGREQRRLNPSN